MYSIHSWLGFPVFLLGIAAFGYALAGLLGKKPYQKRMWDLAGSYTFSLYLQIVIGFFTIFATTNRFLDRYLGLHMILSAAAAVIAHLTYSTNRRRPREERSYTTHVWGVGLSLVLVVAGILAIRTSVFG